MSGAGAPYFNENCVYCRGFVYTTADVIVIFVLSHVLVEGGLVPVHQAPCKPCRGGGADLVSAHFNFYVYFKMAAGLPGLEGLERARCWRCIRCRSVLVSQWVMSICRSIGDQIKQSTYTYYTSPSFKRKVDWLVLELIS